jgi:hypothetical protein
LKGKSGHVIIRGNEPFKKEEDEKTNKLLEYYQLVNNVGIYDPEKNTFYRIPHPVPEDPGELLDHASEQPCRSVPSRHPLDQIGVPGNRGRLPCLTRARFCRRISAWGSGAPGAS